MFLGIDIGTSSVKALAFDEKTRIKAQASYKGLQNNALEYPVHLMEEAIQQAIQSIVQQLGGDASRIQTIGLCGHGPSIVFLDEDGRVNSPLITWEDHRAAQQAEKIRTLDPLFGKDGTSFEAKLLWFYQTHPAVFSGSNKALYPKDYVVALLCGRICVDRSTATCLTHYDRDNNSWKDTFVPTNVMPDVLDPWQVAGVCDSAFSKKCGLAPTTRVVMGGIDCFCEAVGAGAFNPNVVVDGTGTSTCLSRSIHSTPHTSLHVWPNRSLQTRMLSTTGAAYRWFSKEIAGGNADTLQEKLTPNKAQSLLFLPYLNGERSPIWDDKARGTFVGITAGTTKEAMLQAVFQGVAFAIRQNLEDMQKEYQGNDGISTVHAVGGGNKSAAWMQIKANVCNMPFFMLEEQDASAFGAALLGAYGGGFLSKKEMSLFIKTTHCFEPNKESVPAFDALYQSYLQVYPALKDIFATLF